MYKCSLLAIPIVCSIFLAYKIQQKIALYDGRKQVRKVTVSWRKEKGFFLLAYNDHWNVFNRIDEVTIIKKNATTHRLILNPFG
jgi:hypothetical protein